MNTRSKVTYELGSLASGLVGGALAGAVFTRVWRAISGADEQNIGRRRADDVPEPTALDRDIRDVLLVGVLQGAVFGVVKAALGRITARGYRQLTGHELGGAER
ncbi:MAG: DUF4235 domain-containing protein [Actinomycetota bacterium]|nr:DUF4235 domain-containing protein [Actinomycetota bacterium]